MSEQVKQSCHELRICIKDLNVRVKAMFDQVIEAGPKDLAEARSNMKLAYRHLEDAHMRFGKVIQAIDGGVSILDKVDEAGAVAGEAESEE